MRSARRLITMPLIGSVSARGCTPAELAATITAKLKGGFIREPYVAVEIEAYRPFFILGEVAAPGQYPFVPNMTRESAVAIAGGFSPRARRNAVTITRSVNSARPVLLLRRSSRFSRATRSRSANAGSDEARSASSSRGEARSASSSRGASETSEPAVPTVQGAAASDHPRNDAEEARAGASCAIATSSYGPNRPSSRPAGRRGIADRAGGGAETIRCRRCRGTPGRFPRPDGP